MASILSSSSPSLVSIGPYSLHAQVIGPTPPTESQATSKPSSHAVPSSPAPTVIIIPGLGENIIAWSAVIRLLAAFCRVVCYDRAGLGRSPPAPASASPRTAATMARELQSLLKALAIPPPYVLVAHSYGGIIAREFLALQPKPPPMSPSPSQLQPASTVTGLIFVESNTETSHCVRPEDIVIHLSILSQSLDVYAVTDMPTRHRLLPDEWAAVCEIETSTRHQPAQKAAAFAEYLEYEDSCAALSQHRQLQTRALDGHRVSVVKGEELRDVKRILDAARARGHGTAEQQAVVERWVGMGVEEERLQRMHLRLSGQSRWRYASNSGHDVHLTEPEIIAEEVRWVLGVEEEGQGVV